MASDPVEPRIGSIQPIPAPSSPDRSVDATGGPPLWTCPRCGHRFVSANIWHSCSQHSVDEHFARAEPRVRAAFDRLVELYERCGPIVVIAQKTRIVFMVRVRFGGCSVRRDRLLTGISLTRRVDHPRWTKVEELAPGWIAHRFEVRDPDELSDPDLAALICESYREVGEQGRLRSR
ncbi:MAG: DUF5655 domain-containing protein [Candidatus Limnocylindria bacterium]